MNTPVVVVVLSCGDLGIEVANRLHALPAVRSVVLVTAPYRKKELTLRAKLRHIRRTQGLRGFASIAAVKVRALLGSGRPEHDNRIAPAPMLAPGIDRLDFPAFEAPECVQALRARSPDLGVIAGTYILRESVFAIPRLGSINLHSGKVPEYRGAAPAFWELYNGEREVGITIHRVLAAVDAGEVLLQETFPLDPAPAGDPVAYVEQYRRDVLRPNGIRMLTEAVRRIADGSVEGRPQEMARARTYKTPDHSAIRDLRARVATRRLQATAPAGRIP